MLFSRWEQICQWLNVLPVVHLFLGNCPTCDQTQLLLGKKYTVSVSQASLRIIAHEDLHVLMACGYVDDSLLASLDGGVHVAVCSRDSSC